MDEDLKAEAFTDDDGYPPDEDDGDGPGTNVPTPRGQHTRRVMQAKKPQSSPAKRVTRGKKASRILAQEKRRKALELRKAGATYAQIAEAVGYSQPTGARKAVLKAFGEVIQEPVTELKTIQIERLNHMLMVLWPKVQAGDTVAINTSLNVMNKIDALMGTEAARQIEVKNDTAILVVDGNKESYLAALKKMAGAGVQPDGTNAPTAVQTPTPQALPSPPSHRYPPGMGSPEDIIDAELVEDEPSVPAGTDHAEASADPTGGVKDETQEGVQTKKKFSWGVDPTAGRSRRG